MPASLHTAPPSAPHAPQFLAQLFFPVLALLLVPLSAARAGYSWSVVDDRANFYDTVVGYRSAITLMPSTGQPLIAAVNSGDEYFNSASFSIHAIHPPGTPPPASPLFAYGTPPGQTDVLSRTGIIATADGTIHAVYAEYDAGLHYVRRLNNVWTDQVFDSGLYYASLALNADGIPYVAWGLFGSMGYVSPLDPNTFQDLSEHQIHGALPSLNFHQNVPGIAFVDALTGRIAFATQQVGGAWVQHTLPNHPCHSEPSLAFDAVGDPHIAFQTTVIVNNEELRALMHLRRSYGTWYSTVITTPRAWTGVSPAMVLNAQGLARIVYGVMVSGGPYSGVFQVRCAAQLPNNLWEDTMIAQRSTEQIIGWHPYSSVTIEPATQKLHVTFAANTGVDSDPSNQLTYAVGTLLPPPPPEGGGCEPHCIEGLQSGDGEASGQQARILGTRSVGDAGVVVRLSVPYPMSVASLLFDVAGRRVASLESGRLGAGVHELTMAAAELDHGLYFVRLTMESGQVLKGRVLIYDR